MVSKINKQITIIDGLDYVFLSDSDLSTMYEKMLKCTVKQLYLNFENDHDLEYKADFVPVIHSSTSISTDQMVDYLSDDVFIRRRV